MSKTKLTINRNGSIKIEGDFEITDAVAKCVMCLPLYSDLSLEEVDLICRLLLRIQNN